MFNESDVPSLNELDQMLYGTNASDDLYLMHEAYMCRVKAWELENKMLNQVLGYGDKTFNPYFAMGQYASMAIAAVINRVREARADRLISKSDELLALIDRRHNL